MSFVNKLILKSMVGKMHNEHQTTALAALGRASSLSVRRTRMKTVIQWGKVLRKPDIDNLLELIPSSWKNNILSILICETQEVASYINYNHGAKQFVVYTSMKNEPSHEELIELIAVNLQVIDKQKYLPKKIKKSLIAEYTEIWKGIRNAKIA